MHCGSAACSVRVLVVDEDIDRATSLARFLKALGCKTAVAFGVNMGYRIWQMFRPNVAFISLTAASSTGFDTLRELRKLDGLVPQAMVVCLVGQGEGSLSAEAEGCFDRSVSGPEEAIAFRDLLAEAQKRLSAAEVQSRAG